MNVNLKLLIKSNGFCSVHLVELNGTGELFAMKVIEKSVILNRNKVKIIYHLILNFSYFPHVGNNTLQFKAGFKS